MTATEQSAAFYDDLTRLIHRYAEEFEVPLMAVIGCLTMKQHELINSAVQQVQDDEN